MDVPVANGEMLVPTAVVVGYGDVTELNSETFNPALEGDATEQICVAGIEARVEQRTVHGIQEVGKVTGAGIPHVLENDDCLRSLDHREQLGPKLRALADPTRGI